MPLAICATPIGNLDDVTLRVLERAARRRPRPLRGHAADADPPRRGTGSRRASRATTATTRRRARRACSSGCARGERVALVSDAGLPGVNDPGARADRGCRRRGRRRDRAPRRIGGRDRARRQRSRRQTATSSSGISRGGRVSCARLPSELGAMAGAVVAFESPRRLPASLRVLAEALPDRSRRGVPRAHEALRGGRARVARRAGGAVRRAAAR